MTLFGDQTGSRKLIAGKDGSRNFSILLDADTDVPGEQWFKFDGFQDLGSVIDELQAKLHVRKKWVSYYKNNIGWNWPGTYGSSNTTLHGITNVQE